MNLPPKIIRQQIVWQRSGTEKVPLSAARPIVNTTSEIPSPPQGLNSRLIPSITPDVPPPRKSETSYVPAETPTLSSVPHVANDVTNSVTSGTEVGNARPAKVVSTGLDKTLDNLPVLSAFQDFLENEREIMRKRILIMSISYLFLLLLIVGVSITGGMFMLKNLRKDFQNIQAEVKKLQSISMKAKTDSETLSERLAQETVKIRTEMGSSSEESADKFKTRVTVYDEKLSKMEQQVQSLMSENAMLKENLTSLQVGWFNFTNKMIFSSERTENARTQLQKISAQPRILTGISTMTVSMKPEGLDRSIEWRIPIPE
ncbi:MAG: hypothetical protein A2283_02980 [Lentisphaerae bacterium RIFOXYA12_FULL_48_11]|nr:MAG: hypothetical protein A2283_02980 [Lentisphaerae bacterium RIFOXYA12_FULL_48_11]